jgi:hypothetical protein
MTQIESRGLLTSNWAYGLCYPGAYLGEDQEARRRSPQASIHRIRKGEWRSRHSSSKETLCKPTLTGLWDLASYIKARRSQHEDIELLL